MINEPLVSVLMTSYNREKYIAEAIESVIAGSYQNWELIIVDDGSKDNTVAIAKDFASIDKRIHVYINEKNLGDYPNRNRAISYATGEYIMFCDSDDKLFPNSLTNILTIVKRIKEFNFAMYWPHTNETFTLEPESLLRKHFFEKQFLYIGPGGTFMRRAFLNELGGYPEIYGPANDMYFNLKVASITSITLIPFEFVFYRIHDGQELNNRFSYMYNNYRYMYDALHQLPLPFTEKEKKWLLIKNKRRFTVHLFKYLIRTRKINKTVEAYKRAGFSFRDILQGIFH